jgi:hypothetical protein
MKSCLHQFFKWVCRREKSVELPEFPEISFELGWRNTVTIEVQQAIIEEVKRISFDIEPKIWLGIKLLATYIRSVQGKCEMFGNATLTLSPDSFTSPIQRKGHERTANLPYLDAEDIALIKSFPRSMDPDLYFFRHMSTRSGVKAGEQFGPKYFKKWWDKACNNLGIKALTFMAGRSIRPPLRWVSS